MDKLQYALGHIADIRVWRGLAWREYTWGGSMVRESEPGGCLQAFGNDLDDVVRSGIASMQPPKYGLDVYIRFNDLPKAGKSRNWATGNDEAGISAYEVSYDLEHGCYDIFGSLPGAEISYRISGAPIYFIRGDRIGTGSDGEPLLTNVSVVAPANPTKHGYK